MKPEDKDPVHDALDWLLHAAVCELEPGETEKIRTEVIPLARKHYADLQLSKELCLARYHNLLRKHYG